jgi:uncharacterized RDD family membrane protein YckC
MNEAFPAAGLDRRFYAFAIDRAVAWGLQGGAAWFARAFFLDHGHTGTGIGVIVGAVLGVGLAFAVVQGLTGLTPGKALLGLRTVRSGTGGPLGVGRAVLRGLVLWAATLPAFGLGLATLAWTAVSDPGRQRRGWHDQVSGSIVVDTRPAAPEVEVEEQGPRQVVNLTAMRLVPAPPAPEPTPAPAPPPVRPRTTPSAASERPQATPAVATPPAEDGRTVVRGGGHASGPRWRVVFDTGEAFVVEGLGLVGRRPEARQGEPVRHVVPLPSSDMSLSKTHAQFHLAPDGVLVVMDRGSTNGSVLVRQGVDRDLPAGKPATLLDGDLVRFGDREMTVRREPRSRA